MSDVIEIEDRGRLRVLRLNRPERKNALNRSLINALHRVFHDVAEDESVWAVVLTGNGTAFCSGLDLADPVLTGQSDSAGETLADRRGHLTTLMRIDCEKPIVAGVNGIAIGAGLSLALNADIRIAAPSATFHPGYTRVGLSPDLGLTWTLPRAVGYERAMRFLLEVRTVPALEAMQMGLVSEVVQRDEDLEPRILEYGAMLAAVAPIAARQVKRLLNRIEQPVDLDAHLDLENEVVLRAIRSKDSAEAIRALMAHETPTFNGE